MSSEVECEIMSHTHSENDARMFKPPYVFLRIKYINVLFDCVVEVGFPTMSRAVV